MFAADVFEIVLAIAVLISTAFTVFILTLPKPYDHFNPPQLAEKDFTDEDRKNGRISGYDRYKNERNEAGLYVVKTSVQVVVLGDLGRSPRMQYHAMSLAKHGCGVQLIGYLESQPPSGILESRFINVVDIARVPAFLQTQSKALFLILGPLKALYQTWALYQAMAYRASASKYMLVQNPPSIPVLAVAVFICFFRNTKLIVDWHNFGYSILALRLGKSHPLVQLSRWYENLVSRAADAHFTVTIAMGAVLNYNLGITPITLHDRPADQFQPVSQEQRRKFLQSCNVTRDLASEVEQRSTRLLVSSTSWTTDEDFGVLLEALVAYSQSASNAILPELLVIITGKGPQKADYEAKIRNLEHSGKLAHVSIRTAWLSIADYASLLAAADLGVCLHTSSSGVDLPMKVLDMFGAGLPVVGWSKYASWPELVHEGKNGMGFRSAEELQQVLEHLLVPGHDRLSVLRAGAFEEGKYRWDQEWDKSASSVFGL